MRTGRRTLRELAPEAEEEFIDEPPAPAWFAVARGAAFFIGCVLLLNMLGEMRFPHSNPSASWVDLRPLPRPAARGFLGTTAVLLVFFSLFPRMNAALRSLATLCTLGLLGAALWNAYRFYQLVRGGQLQTDVPVPFALHVAGIAAAILPALLIGQWERFNFGKDFVFGSLTVAACVVALPLAQFFCFGRAEEREHGAADAVVILIDAAEAANAPQTQKERIAAGCALYRAGQAHKLVLIGSSRDASKEADQTIRRLAVEQGIPEADVVVNSSAARSDESLISTVQSLQQQKLIRVLISGRFFQLPRLKLCCQRAGLDVRCVPIREEVRIEDLRRPLIREGTALWLCYLEPLLK